MSTEHAACHEQSSMHPRIVALECSRMADQLKDMRRLLRNTQFRGLAALVHHAQLELEQITITAKEAAEHG